MISRITTYVFLCWFVIFRDGFSSFRLKNVPIFCFLWSLHGIHFSRAAYLACIPPTLCNRHTCCTQLTRFFLIPTIELQACSFGPIEVQSFMLYPQVYKKSFLLLVLGDHFLLHLLILALDSCCKPLDLYSSDNKSPLFCLFVVNDSSESENANSNVTFSLQE